jgi:hypothetical protein
MPHSILNARLIAFVLGVIPCPELHAQVVTPPPAQVPTVPTKPTAEDEAKARATLLAAGVAVPGTVIAATALEDTLDARAARRKEARVFKLGLSVGWRSLRGTQSDLLRDAVINPATNAVEFERIDRTSVLASGVLAVFPRKKSPKDPCDRCTFAAWWRVGFLANIKLTAFGADQGATFNQNVEGGIGPVYRFSDDFALALTLERAFIRRPRSFIVAGQPVFDTEPSPTRKPLAALDPSDNRFFIDDNLTAWSFKFVYFLR